MANTKILRIGKYILRDTIIKAIIFKIWTYVSMLTILQITLLSIFKFYIAFY